MKKKGNILSWIGVGFLALIGIGAFGSGDVLSGVILELVAIALIPVSPIKDFWLKLPEKFKWVKAVSLVVLFLIGMGVSSPAEEAKVSQPETSEEAIVTQEEKDDKKPAAEKETEDASEDAQKSTSEKEENKKEELPPETTTKTPEVTSEKTEVPVTTTKPSTSTTAKVPTTTTKAPVTTTVPPTTTTQAPTTTTRAPVTTTTQNPGGNGDPDNDDTNGQIVYRTPKGSRWHIDPQCGGANSYSVQRSEAESAGLTPCGTCVH